MAKTVFVVPTERQDGEPMDDSDYLHFMVEIRNLLLDKYDSDKYQIYGVPEFYA